VQNIPQDFDMVLFSLFEVGTVWTGDEHQPSCDEIAVLLDCKQERSDLLDIPLNSNINDGHFLCTYPVPQSTGQYKHDKTHALVEI